MLWFIPNLQFGVCARISLKRFYFNRDPPSTSPERPVVVIRYSLHYIEQSPWGAADGAVPVVPDSHVEVPFVKILKVLIHWHKILL